MKTPYGTWDSGTFTSNDGQVYQDNPDGWSPAVAADGPGLGALLKGLFGSAAAPAAGSGAPMPPARPAASFSPEFSAPASVAAGPFPTMARPAGPAPSMTLAGEPSAMPTFAMPGVSGVTPQRYVDPQTLASVNRTISAIFPRRRG